MTMKLNGMVNYQEKRAAFVAAVKNKESDEKINELYVESMNALAEDMVSEAKKEARLEAEGFINASKMDNTITPQEIKFFNSVNTETGWKEETLLPETVIDRIFEDLTTEHPLLSELGLRYTGLRLKVLKSDASGAIVWGKIFGDIKGQLDAAFSDEEANQSKATAFLVLPNDILEFGPVWVKRYVTMQIKEAFAVGFEDAFLNGDGKDKPIGLSRNVSKDVTVTGGVYPEKDPSGTFTFADEKTAINEFKELRKYHSVKENGKRISVAGKVVIVASPDDALDIEAEFTSRNAMGDWVTKLPFNLRIVESEFQSAGKITTFVNGRYDAYAAGPLNIKEYDQTLALEDCKLYTAKQFTFGKAQDDKAAAVWLLAIGGAKAAKSTK